MRLILVCALWVLVPLSSAAEKEQWHNVKGHALRNLFQDKEFGDGVHFAYYLKANGTFTGTEMTKQVSGSWRVEKNEFCWKWKRPPGPEECYQVQQDRVQVRLLVNGSEAWYGALKKVP